MTVYMLLILISENDPDVRERFGDVEERLRASVAAYEWEAVVSACAIAGIAAQMSSTEARRLRKEGAASAANLVAGTVRPGTLAKVERVASEVAMGIDANASDLYPPAEDPFEVVRAALALISHYLSTEAAASRQPFTTLLAELSAAAMSLTSEG